MGWIVRVWSFDSWWELHPDWPCGPHSLISNGYWGSFPMGKVARA